MVVGKTKSGFSFCIPKRRMQSMELMDALAEMQEENPLAISRVVKMLLGDDQRKKLYDHLRGEDGVVSAEDVGQAITEIFEAFGKEGKNS